jgi:hypothetical protein
LRRRRAWRPYSLATPTECALVACDLGVCGSIVPPCWMQEKTVRSQLLSGADRRDKGPLPQGESAGPANTIGTRIARRMPFVPQGEPARQGKRRKERCRDDRQALRSVPRGTWGTGRIACATERQRRNQRQRRRPEASGTKGKSNRKRAGGTPFVPQGKPAVRKAEDETMGAGGTGKY